MSSSPGPSPRGTSLKTKLLVFLTALLVGLGALLGGVSLHEEQRYMEDSLREGIRKDYLLFRALWEGETERAISLAEAVRANEEWTRLFAEGRREELLTRVLPFFEAMKKNHGLGNLQYHLPPATSFLRLHRPDKHGDDLPFRKALLGVNQSQTPYRGPELGKEGFYLRGILPIVLEGTHRGSVETGTDTRFLLEEAAKQTGASFALLATPEGIRESGFETKRSIGTLPLIATSEESFLDRTPKELVERALAGGEQDLRLEEDLFFAAPLKDGQGNPVAVILLRRDCSAALGVLARMRRITFGLVGGAVLLALLLGVFLLNRLLFRPLGELLRLTQDLAQGDADLTKRLPVPSRDEIGQLAEGFNRFLSNLGDLVVQVKEDARSLAQETGRVNASTEAMSRTARSLLETGRGLHEMAAQNSGSVESLNAAIQEVASGSQTAAEAGGKAAENAEGVRGLAHRVEERVVELREVAEELEDRTQGTRERMAAVETHAAEIGTLVEGIGRIADQTNLLALNAAIEAARAGEHGRGFAVVAEEVRKLAEESNEAASRITGLVASIGGAVQDASSAIEAAGGAVSRSVDRVSQVDTHIQELLNRLGGVVDAIQDIAAVSEEQSAAAQEVASSTDQIAGYAHTTAGSAETVSNLSQECDAVARSVEESVELLQERARNLEGLVAGFRTRETRGV